MSLEDLGNIGEFIGAIGVVFSLFYLAIQIRQNTRQLEQNTRSVRSSSFHAASIAVGSYISPIDALLSRLFAAYEVLFYQHRDSLVEPELWESRARNLVRYIRQPGGRDYWKRRGGLYAESFRQYVDDQLQDESAV